MKKHKTLQEAIDEFRRKMQNIADKDGITISVSAEGEDPVVIAEPKNNNKGGK